MQNKGGCDEEIKRRWTMAINATIKLPGIWKDLAKFQHSKVKLLHTKIIHTVAYPSVTWSFKLQSEEQFILLKFGFKQEWLKDIITEKFCEYYARSIVLKF